MKIGYACINMTLKDQGITTNRGMRKATFESKGLSYVSELALENVKGLLEIVQWNVDNNIHAFRMSSSLFPWFSEYEIPTLPDWPQINEILWQTGQLALQNDMRISFHPGSFTILCSPKEQVVRNAIKELNQHAFILDAMGLPCNVTHKVNIHIGGAYGDKQSAMDRWISNFKLLSESAKNRITIENDDKPNMYDVQDLLYVSDETGCPIVFDFHHHDCHPGSLSKEDALVAALETWPSGITPMTHYSSCKRVYEDSTSKVVAHADYLHEQIPFTDKYNFDVMVEAKAKELAVQKYLEDYKPANYLVC